MGSRRLLWAKGATQTEDRHRVRHGPKHPRGTVVSPAPRHNASRDAPLRLGAAHACYDTNEVLVIIGLTCVVNLAFVAAVLCLVHMCSRHRASWSDAAALMADGGDVPLLIPAEECTTYCCPISSYSGVQEYANSFTDSASQHKYGDHRASSRSMEHLLFIG